MANKKISELTSITGAAINPAADLIAIVDVSAGETKKGTFAAAKEGMGLDEASSPGFTGISIGATDPGSINGSSGSIDISAAGTNQDITLTPSGTGEVNINSDVTADNIVWDGTERFREFNQAVSATNFHVANVVIFGDSWTARGYWPNYLDAALRTKYGFRGCGWLSADKERGNTIVGRTGGTVTQAGTWEQRYSTNHGALIHATYVGPDGQVAVSTDIATPGSYIFSASATNVLELYYLKQPNGGDFRWRVDAGGWTTVNTTNATNDLGLVTASGLSSGPHTMTIEVTVAGSAGVGIFGVDSQWTASPNRGVRLHNLSISGSIAEDLTLADATLWQTQIDRLDPDLAILLFSTNEHDTNVTPAAFVANLTTIITRLRVVVPNVDIVLMPASDDGKVGKTYTKLEYRNAAETLARTLRIGFADIYNLVGDYTTANTLGYYEDDSHLSIKGYEVIANYLYRQLTGENFIHVGEHLVDGGGNDNVLTIVSTGGTDPSIKWLTPSVPVPAQGNSYSNNFKASYNGSRFLIEGNGTIETHVTGGVWKYSLDSDTYFDFTLQNGGLLVLNITDPGAESFEIDDPTSIVSGGAASRPALLVSGEPAGGTGTTAHPKVYISDPSATASTTLGTSGTEFGINGNGVADLVNVMADGGSRFKVGPTGLAAFTGVGNDSASPVVINPTGGQNRTLTIKEDRLTVSRTSSAGIDAILMGSGVTGFWGINTTNPGAALEINLKTTDKLRLTYNDADGSAANYTEIGVGSSGAATFDSIGSSGQQVLIFNKPIRLPAYTVATLPAGVTVGAIAYVTDATAPTYLGALVGGGAVTCPVFHNGTAWVSH